MQSQRYRVGLTLGEVGRRITPCAVDVGSSEDNGRSVNGRGWSCQKRGEV